MVSQCRWFCDAPSAGRRSAIWKHWPWRCWWSFTARTRHSAGGVTGLGTVDTSFGGPYISPCFHYFHLLTLANCKHRVASTGEFRAVCFPEESCSLPGVVSDRLSPAKGAQRQSVLRRQQRALPTCQSGAAPWHSPGCREASVPAWGPPHLLSCPQHALLSAASS